MLVQEPVTAAIWHCLNHYAYNDAIFLAERLKAEVDSEETTYVLATCYYRSGKPNQAYAVLKNATSAQCRFLLAKCCLELQRLSEAESVLVGGEVGRSKTLDDVAKEFGETACFALMLIATVCFSTERHQRGVEASRKALRLNPLLWSVFEQLCKRGDKPDPNKAFNVTPFDSIDSITGPNSVISYANSQSIASAAEIAAQTPDSIEGKPMSVNSASTPLHVVNVGNMCLSGIREFSPDVSPLPLSAIARPKRAARFKSLFAGSLAPTTPSFGVLQDLSPKINEFNTPVNTLSEMNVQKVLFRSQLTRKERPLQQTQPMYPQSIGTTPLGVSGSPQMSANTYVQPPSVRRSSRIFTNSYAVKENTKSPSYNKFASPKSPSRKTKSRLAKQALTRSNCSELNDRNMRSNSLESPGGLIESPPILGSNCSNVLCKSLADRSMTLQKNSLEGIAALMRELGRGFVYLSQFECKKAIEVFKSLPPHQQATGWVLTLIGKAYFEMADFKQACRTFSDVRKLEPERCTYMEIYSTALWHLQRESVLSALAQDLVELDKNSPEAWCAAGNCFSLQKDHDIAIKYFQRAVQVDPNFAYAYTLLGHEYISTEELEKGMSCFRNAVRLDTRHYNAWYGIGTIYSKQEKYQLAELHYKRALSINPNNCVLMCHIGVVQHALQMKEEALETLNKAISIEPNSALCKFHRASILASCNRHQEALRELDELKEIVPKESLVYFLAGKVHKRLGNTHLALMHFSWATDLDPKGATSQIKEAIDPGIAHSQDVADESAAEDLQRTPPEEPPVEQHHDSDESIMSEEV